MVKLRFFSCRSENLKNSWPIGVRNWRKLGPCANEKGNRIGGKVKDTEKKFVY